MTAAATLPTPLIHQLIGSPISAAGTDETLGPAAGREVLFAGFLSSEVALELPQDLGNGGLDTFHTTHWGLLSLPGKQKTPSSRCQDMVDTLVLRYDLITTTVMPTTEN